MMVKPDLPEKNQCFMITGIDWRWSQIISSLFELKYTSHDLPVLQKHFSWGFLIHLNTMVEPDFPEKIAFLRYTRCRNRLVIILDHLEINIGDIWWWGQNKPVPYAVAPHKPLQVSQLGHH
ncbi:hypothetical protein DFJ58DRAFT_847721 [Suillus subalutaceus]|uniref:uncharacterized protein n=1 Tax=Suillus subalutaceus TaxID=48586 RepID=UPI001B88349D|nr:uncharacterized protein DFJ58DRAFT_847721 [Suillus subalutaceus]KAG1834011.1 hypothetical protein DFJ58DRAFT_847721 [Suillus subalutaceus]